MKRNQVGETGVSVTEVSFGCSGIGNLFREVSEGEAQDVLEHAWARGIRYFDTAPHYGRGLSEQRVGAFLRGRNRDDLVLSTKVGRLLAPGPALEEADGFVRPLPNAVRFDYSGEGIEAAFEQSCERLGTRFIDIVYVHDIGADTHGAAENARHMSDLLGSGLERLRRLKSSGRLRAFGLGVNEAQVCLDVMTQTKIDVILLAGRLTLLDRSAEADLVPACRRTGTSLVLGGIFNSGILATGPVPGATYDYGPAPHDVIDRVRSLEAEAASQGRSLAEAALRFALGHPAAASVLLGTAKASSLERNLAMVPG